MKNALRRLFTWDKKKASLVRFLLIISYVVFVMFFVFRRTVVEGHSMDNTLYHGQSLFSVRLPFVPVRNDDIVVAWLESEKLPIIKRVMACPGDTIEIRDDQVYRNGALLEEPYIKEPMSTADIAPQTMGEDEYFLMGDNRNNSLDSRKVGSFTRDTLFSVVYLEQQGLVLSAQIILVGGGFLVYSLMDSKKKKEDYIEDRKP